jgi:hypothetical protein
MTTKERKEHIRLGIRWLNRKATKRQILRCMELDRKFEFENRQLIFSTNTKPHDAAERKHDVRQNWQNDAGSNAPIQ